MPGGWAHYENEESATVFRNLHGGLAERRAGGGGTFGDTKYSFRCCGGGDTFVATASAARSVFYHINALRVNSSHAMHAAHAVTPNLAPASEEGLP
jgi:hypothetical protein